jgi:hypothetical protein
MLNPVFCETYYLGYYEHAIKQKNNNRYSAWRHCKKYKNVVWCNVQHITIMRGTAQKYKTVWQEKCRKFVRWFSSSLLHYMMSSTQKTLLHIQCTIKMRELSCCKIWGSYESEYENYHLPGMWHYAVCKYVPTFWKNIKNPKYDKYQPGYMMLHPRRQKSQ